MEQLTNKEVYEHIKEHGLKSTAKWLEKLSENKHHRRSLYRACASLKTQEKKVRITYNSDKKSIIQRRQRYEQFISASFILPNQLTCPRNKRLRDPKKVSIPRLSCPRKRPITEKLCDNLHPVTGTYSEVTRCIQLEEELKKAKKENEELKCKLTEQQVDSSIRQNEFDLIISYKRKIELMKTLHDKTVKDLHAQNELLRERVAGTVTTYDKLQKTYSPELKDCVKKLLKLKVLQCHVSDVIESVLGVVNFVPNKLPPIRLIYKIKNSLNTQQSSNSCDFEATQSTPHSSVSCELEATLDDTNSNHSYCGMDVPNDTCLEISNGQRIDMAAQGTPHSSNKCELEAAQGTPQSSNSCDFKAAQGTPQSSNSCDFEAAQGTPQSSNSCELEAAQGTPHSSVSCHFEAAQGTPQSSNSCELEAALEDTNSNRSYCGKDVPNDVWNIWKFQILKAPTNQY